MQQLLLQLILRLSYRIQEILVKSPRINGKATWNSRRKLKIRAAWHEKQKVSGLQNKECVGEKKEI